MANILLSLRPFLYLYLEMDLCGFFFNFIITDMIHLYPINGKNAYLVLYTYNAHILYSTKASHENQLTIWN